jgi:alpha-tubulin suppressor-like RCC1 family protein
MNRSLCIVLFIAAAAGACLVANPADLYFKCSTDSDCSTLDGGYGYHCADTVCQPITPDAGVCDVVCNPGYFRCSSACADCCRVVDLSLGRAHTCAVLSNGGALCWGDNSAGQLGDGAGGPDASQLIPTPVAGSYSFSTIAANGDETCAATPGGEACWGTNNRGQLGDGQRGGYTTQPESVRGLSSTPVAVVEGLAHSCALDSEGALLCWGDNIYGEMGNYGSYYVTSALPVSGLDPGVTGVSAGWGFSCAIVGAGDLKCWGYDCDGELGFDGGDCSDGGYSGTPTPTDLGLSGVSRVSAKLEHACAVVQGSVLCWGYNYSGQIGDGTYNDAFAPTPANDAGMGVVADVAVGWYHTCALTEDGTVYCWGDDLSGQLGDGFADDNACGVRPYPSAPVSGLGTVVLLRAGGSHSCALDADGSVWCWGANGSGQLGNGNTTSSSVPVRVQF